MSDQFPLLTEFGEPIVFRTVDPDVYRSTLEAGSIWLRSDAYYREIEDAARVDKSEGINASLATIPLNIFRPCATPLTVQGCGKIGVAIVPHYIASFHGLSIAKELIREFGGFTFGVKSFSRLSAEILCGASRQIRCSGYRFGAVSYQRTNLAMVHGTPGGSAIQLAGDPPAALCSVNSDVLRKDPVEPFIRQDEWRIAVFTDGYLCNDAQLPLKINVCPTLFFPYRQTA